MNKSIPIILATVLASCGMIAPADARRPEQDAAYQASREGAMGFREIERKVLSTMKGASYLGPEYDSSSSTYRLKFMRGGSVIWVDVDSRSGSVVRRSGK